MPVSKTSVIGEDSTYYNTTGQSQEISSPETEVGSGSISEDSVSNDNLGQVSQKDTSVADQTDSVVPELGNPKLGPENSPTPSTNGIEHANLESTGRCGFLPNIKKCGEYVVLS